MTALFEVFYRPAYLFRSLPERKAAWVLPLILNCLLLLLVSWLVPHFVGRENVVRQQLEGFGMSPEATQQAIAKSGSPGRVYTGYAGAVIATAVILLIVSVALWAFSMMTSRTPKFADMFSMVNLAFFPYWLVTAAMTALILIASPDPASLNIKNLIATNVAAFMDKNSVSKGLYSLLSSIDILSFALIGLLSLGFARLTRVSFFFGLAATLGLWAFYVSCKMAISLLF